MINLSLNLNRKSLKNSIANYQNIQQNMGNNTAAFYSTEGIGNVHMKANFL